MVRLVQLIFCVYFYDYLDIIACEAILVEFINL